MTVTRLVIGSMLTGILLLTGCATGTQREGINLAEKLAEHEFQLAGPVQQISNYRINSWRYLDRNHMILQARHREYYLISFQIPCTSLSAASDIGFTSTASSLTKFEKIIVTGLGSDTETCPIADIHRLEKIEEDADGEDEG